MTGVESPEDTIRRLRARLSHALLAEGQEVERLEQAVRDLRARHDELEQAFEQEMAGSPHEALASAPAESNATDHSGRTEPPAPERLVDQVPEERVLGDAQRFARLLVSEIVLYHSSEVDEGRLRGDLYARLRASIDRSRQAYERRFGQTAAARSDFFHDELVRTLASNNPALLGSNYPGPSA